MKKIIGAMFVVFLSMIGMSVACAEDMKNTQSVQKIAVVHVQRILQDAPKVAAVNKKLQDEFQPRQDKLSALQKEVQKEVDDLNKNAAIMKEADKIAAQDKANKDRTDFLTQANTLQTDFNKAQTAYMKDIFEALNKVLTAMAKKEGYTLILDSQAVAFADPSLDITSNVLAAFNSAE